MSLHYKKDGTLDMRYTSSREAMSSTFSMGSNAYHGSSNYSPLPPSRSSDYHYKKDGTLDMRYTSSKLAAAASAQSSHINRPSSSTSLHYKKDGTLDMRYTSSKSSYVEHGVPKTISMTKTGIPDMRTSAAKEWVKQQALLKTNTVPSWVTKTKDGSLDYSKAVTQEYLKHRGASSTNNIPDQRLAYYCQRLEDMLFKKLIEDARTEPVDMPEYEMLPATAEIQRQFSSRSMGSSTTHANNDFDIRSEISKSATLIDYRDLRINLENKLGQGSFGIFFFFFFYIAFYSKCRKRTSVT